MAFPLSAPARNAIAYAETNVPQSPWTQPPAKGPRPPKMAKLNAAARNKIPSSKFGLPKQRKYPMEDRKHEIAAKGRATQMVKKGKLSPASAARIRAKANALLGK